jgi:DNA-binding FrmR family transcriptional regulator
LRQTHFSVANPEEGIKCVYMKSKHIRHGLEKRALIVRLRRIKGQIEGIEKMVEADTDCSDVLMQVVSARRALKSFSEEMIQSPLHECIEGAATPSESRRELHSLLTVLKRYAV